MSPKIKVEVRHKDKVVHSDSFREFPILFGRNPECQLKLDRYGFISRVHGSIGVDKEDLVVTDLGSKNGILSQGKRVFSVRGHDVLKFDVEDLTFKVEFESKGEVDPDATEITVLKTQIGEVLDDVRFSIAPYPEIVHTPRNRLVLQSVVTWDDDVYDVRNFFPDDEIRIGGTTNEPIYIPTLKEGTSSGRFSTQGAIIKVAAQGRWVLYRNKKKISLQELENSGHAKRQGNFLLIQLGLEDVLSQNVSSELIVHFRYVKAPVFRMPRTWIENKEEFKKAAFISLGVHLALCLLVVLGAPKSNAPKIENVPPRIAKLLVEPPAQILAAQPKPPPPPPPPPPEPEPEPEPPVQAKKPEPKVQPKKAEAPKPKPKPKVVKRIEPKARVVAKSRPQPPEEPSAPPAPSAEDIAALLNTLPGPPSGGSIATGAPIQIAQKDISAQGVRVAGVAAAAASIPTSSGTAQEAFNLAQGGTQGYAKASGGKAGKRNVQAKVIGTPSLAPDLGREQGLTNDQVMAVVNKHLGGVQRCYERALFEDGSLSGRVEYEWEISPQGRVSDIKVTRSQIARADTLNNCIFELFRKMSFPNAKNGQTTIAKIGFPFGK